jgi:hypothetical protein
MKTNMAVRLACRYCRHYAPEGRRGGTCQKLGVQVRGSWTACSLVQPSFSPVSEVNPPILDETILAGSVTPVSYPPVPHPILAKSSQVPA